MLLIAVISLSTIVAAWDFCRINYRTKTSSRVCFTNFPDELSLCPNHKLGTDRHGQIGNPGVAEALYLPFPSNCGPMVDGVQRCTGTIKAWSERTNTFMDYAYVWSDRSINKQGHPSYYFGGIFWLQVRISPICSRLINKSLRIRETRTVREIGAWNVPKTVIARATHSQWAILEEKESKSHPFLCDFICQYHLFTDRRIVCSTTKEVF